MPRQEQPTARYSQTALTGSTQQAKIQREQNFKQAGDLYRSFNQKERNDLIESFGGSLATTDDESKHIILSFLYKADPEYGTRSEEHTSELQSLMRISYAVFCLKKKNQSQNNN